MGETCSQVAAPQAPWVPCMLQAPWPPWSKWFGVPNPAAESTGAPKSSNKTAKKLWFMMVYYGLWWFIMVYDGLLWFMMVYYGLLWILRSSNLSVHGWLHSFSKASQSGPRTETNLGRIGRPEMLPLSILHQKSSIRQGTWSKKWGWPRQFHHGKFLFQKGWRS